MKTMTKLVSLAGLALGLTVAAQAQLVSVSGDVSGYFIAGYGETSITENPLQQVDFVNFSNIILAVDPDDGAAFPPNQTIVNDASSSSMLDMTYSYVTSGNGAPLPTPNAVYRLLFDVTSVKIGLNPAVAVSEQIAVDVNFYFTLNGNAGSSISYDYTPIDTSFVFQNGLFQFAFDPIPFADQDNPMTAGVGGVSSEGNVNASLRYSAVPEPSTYGLIGAAALLGLVGYRRFKGAKVVKAV